MEMLTKLMSRLDIIEERLNTSQVLNAKDNNHQTSSKFTSIIGASTGAGKLENTYSEESTPSRYDRPVKEQSDTAFLSKTVQRKQLGELLRDNDMDDDSEPQVRIPKNTARRQSVFFRQITQASEDSNNLVIHGQQPTFDHIKLNTLAVWAVFDFFDKIVEYQTVHKLKLPVTSLVSKAVREELISRYAPELTLERFHKLTHTEICLLAQDVVKPQSELAFLKSLKDNATFPDLPPSYVPSVTNFMPFYRAILIYKTRFMRVYEFLASNNDNNVPPCHNKEGGIIKLFLEALPHEFGKRVWQHINRQRRDFKDRDKNYTVNAFFRTFTELLQHALDIAESTRSVKELFGGTAYEARKGNPQMLHAIEVPDQAEHFLPDDQTDYDTADVAMYDQYLQYAQQQQTPTSSYKPNQKSAPIAKQDMACFEKVFHDKCNKDNCKWSHETSVIRKARDNFETLLSKLKRPATQTAQLGVRSPPQRVSAILDRRIHESTEIATAVDNIDVPPDNYGDY